MTSNEEMMVTIGSIVLGVIISVAIIAAYKVIEWINSKMNRK